MELSPRKYQVEVSAGGHATRKEWIDLSVGEDKDFEIRLKPMARKMVTKSAGRSDGLSSTLSRFRKKAATSSDETPQQRFKKQSGYGVCLH